MASADTASIVSAPGPLPLELSLRALAAHYGCLGDALEELHAALVSGDAVAISTTARTIAGLASQTHTAYGDLLPDASNDGSSTALIERIRAAEQAVPPSERDRLMEGAELVAVRMNRALELRARLGSLATDLASTNEQMLDIVRQLDRRGTTYDRTSTQRPDGLSRNLLDTHA